MEKLKDPAMLLSVANSIGLVGTTAYFYKQLEAMRLDMVKMSQTLTGAIRKIAEMEKGEQHKSEALHTLNDQIKRLNEQIEGLPTFDFVDNMDIDLTEIITVLCDHEIPVERPSQAPRSRRSGDRRIPVRKDQYTDDRGEVLSRRAPMRSSNQSRTDTSRDQDSRSQSARDPRSQPSVRELRPLPPTRDIRQDSKGEIPYDDDLDLIGEVRRQQARN